MGKIGLIHRKTFNDDSLDYATNSYKICASIEEAKEVVLNEVKTDFGDMDNCHSLEDVATELTNSDIHSYCDDNTFTWEDNCKGEEYHFIEIDTDSKEYHMV